MNVVTMTRVLRPVATLLGGSGRARVSITQGRHLPALLKPPLGVPPSSDGTVC